MGTRTKYKNLAGKQFGHWTVLKHCANRNGKRRVISRCKCGLERKHYITTLVHASSKQCRSCQGRSQPKSHGLAHLATYKRWGHIKSACHGEKSQSYKYFGARGIKMYEGWHDAKAFVKWCEENGYTPGATLARYDLNKDFCPENCFWQITNKHRSKSKTTDQDRSVPKVEITRIQPSTKTTPQFTGSIVAKSVSPGNFCKRVISSILHLIGCGPAPAGAGTGV